MNLSWPLLLSFVATALIVVLFQVFTYRRRLRARLQMQMELMVKAELEKQVREQLGLRLAESLKDIKQ